MRLKDIMSDRVEKIGPDETPERARALLRTRDAHQVVVVEGGKVVGIVTADDLATPEARTAQTVASIMTIGVTTAPPTLTVRRAANLLRGASTGTLPVVDKGRLVGIVTVADLLELIGRGMQRPVDRGERWTLRHRGQRPNRVQAGQHR
jgi:acetoin utilization protein AcuB